MKKLENMKEITMTNKNMKKQIKNQETAVLEPEEWLEEPEIDDRFVPIPISPEEVFGKEKTD